MSFPRPITRDGVIAVIAIIDCSLFAVHGLRFGAYGLPLDLFDLGDLQNLFAAAKRHSGQSGHTGPDGQP